MGTRITRRRAMGIRLIFSTVIYYTLMCLYIDTVYGAELTSFNMEFTKVYNKRSTYMPQFSTHKYKHAEVKDAEHWAYGLNLNFNIDLGLDTYWKNTVYSMTTTRQFRYVSWEYEFGHSINETFDLFYNHRSEHTMEVEARGYPLHDVIGVRFNLIK